MRKRRWCPTGMRATGMRAIFALTLTGACGATGVPPTPAAAPARARVSVPTQPVADVTAIRGVVLDAEGSPVSAAVVAVVGDRSDVASAVTVSASDGSFSFAVAPGRYAFTATAPSHAAAFAPVRERTHGDKVELRLATQGDVHRGTVYQESGEPWPSRRVRIQRASQVSGDVFYVDTDVRGNFEVRLPRAVGYQFGVDVPGKMPIFENVAGKPTKRVRLAMPAIASEAVIAWIRKHSVHVESVAAGSGFVDLRPLKRSVGAARIVGLGEATHGSRELREIRTRLLEYLVTELGFTALAIESSFSVSLAINEYVLGKSTAPGPISSVMARARSQPETFAAFEWIRRYNADPSHTDKVQVVGVDIQRTAHAAQQLTGYFDKVDRGFGKRVRVAVARFLDRNAMRRYSSATAAQRTQTRANLARLVRRLAHKKLAYIRSSDRQTWEVAKHLVQTLVQAERMYAVMVGPNTAAFNVRDRAMADNTKWILDTQPAGAKVVYWAHNGHVAVTHPRRTPQGSHLRAMFGQRYMSIATTFAEGSFRAVGRKDGRPTRLQQHVVGLAAPGTVGRTLHRTGLPILFLDMRRRPTAGPVFKWFQQPHPIRSIGAVFMGERYSYTPVELPRAWDALIFVRKTSALPVPTQRR